MSAPAREPKWLVSDEDRKMARHMRDRQWRLAERAAEHGTLWICWWNKNHHHDTSQPLAADLEVCGLIDGMELLNWLKAHEDWWSIGEWSDDRYAAPVSITEAGREALRNRHLYDMEPVKGGLVDPGWQAIPTETKLAG
jgi:hypothetical protein